MEEIKLKLDEVIAPLCLEAYPFKLGWYNENVHKSFVLQYDSNTLAFVIISRPKMFENVFIPFLLELDGKGGNDALDECMKVQFKKIKEAFPDRDVHYIHDFEFHHSKRPKVLVQTAGHVSGGVYYYQRKNVIDSDPWPEDKKIFGVCVHPHYGGWFGLRGVFIFKDVKVPTLEKKEMTSFLNNNQIIDLLTKYNFDWNDGAFRDVVEPVERYSDIQKKYFLASMDERPKLIEEIKNGTYLSDCFKTIV